jgi:IS5 family transposase
MRPKERRDSGQRDLFRARLDQIVDTSHPLAKLGGTIDWGFLEHRLGAVYADVPGRPPLPTRLMAGLAILKHMHNLSDEALCERWLENPYFQLFCGAEFFQHKLPFDRSSLTRWRQRMGEEKLVALVQESLSVATKTGAATACTRPRSNASARARRIAPMSLASRCRWRRRCIAPRAGSSSRM